MEQAPGGVPYDYDEVWANVYGDIQAHGPVHRHSRRLMAGLLSGISYRSVLDIGCGPAVNYPMLSAGVRLEEFSGLDISPKALEVARRLVPHGNFTTADIQLEHPDGRWDLVNCSYVLEHLADDLGALAHMRAVTGGHLLVATIAGDFDRHRAWEQRVGHVRNYRRGELEEKLNTVGFSVDRIIYWGFPFYSPLGRRVQDRSDLGVGSYSMLTRLIAKLTYGVYWLNSQRRGDIVIALASPRI